MSGRRNSKRNSVSAESEPASKRHKADDPSTVSSSTNGNNTEERAGPRAPSFDEDSVAKLPSKERSCLVDLPYPDQVQRHVRWRQSGREHDDFCFVCEQPDDLIFCYTCRRSYHPSCMSSPHDFPGEEWWCPVCVLRGWDKWTPEATLIFPVPPDDVEDLHSTHVHNIAKAPVQEDKENATQPPQRHAHYYAATPSHIAPSIQPIAPAVRPGPPPTTHREPPSENRDQSLKQRSQPRARKSRYSNFLPEVDSAISIIYRELESTSDLRSQLVDTQTEVRTLSQELRIRDNQLLLANKISTSKQALEVEVANLKAELASKRSSSGEVEYLKEGYAKLEAEVRELRTQLQQKDKEKDEWRDKLRRLIEPGAT